MSSYVYKVAALALNAYGIPIFPGADHVSVQMSGYFVAYGPPVGRRFPTLAVIYQDYLTQRFLIGANQAVLDTVPDGQSLDALVAADPANWGCWSCDTIQVNGEVVLQSDSIAFTTNVLATISTLLPCVLSAQLVAIGGQPLAPAGLGDFNLADLRTMTTWLGDRHILP